MYDYIIRLVLAVIVGAIIGFEREKKNKPAGFITHTMVCMGACMVSIMQMMIFHEMINLVRQDPSLKEVIKIDTGRIIAQVISGVGFLGAGTIIQNKDKVSGITTAATLWVSACIGLIIGLGFYYIALVSSFLAIFVLVIMTKFERKYINRNGRLKILRRRAYSIFLKKSRH